MKQSLTMPKLGKPARAFALALLCISLIMPARPALASDRNTKTIDLGQLLVSLLTGGGKGRIRTTLDKDNVRAIEAMKISRKKASPFVAYRVWPTCTFSAYRKKAEKTDFWDVQTFSSRPVRDRFLVSVKHARGISTALIGPDGTAYDFNFIDPEDGTRVTRETLSAYSARKMREYAVADRNNGTERVTIDPMTVIFPVIGQKILKPGELVGQVRRSDGGTHAELIFGGTLKYKGFDAIALEVVINRDGKLGGGPILIGHYVLRQDNLMPLRTVWQTGELSLLELIGCT